MSESAVIHHKGSITPTQAMILERRQNFYRSISRLAVEDDGIDLKRKWKPPIQLIDETVLPPEINDAVFGGEFIPQLVRDFDNLMSPSIASTSSLLSIRDIQNAVCRITNISYMDLISSRRTDKLVRPRQIAMALCKELTPRSLPDIGRRFKRDHTTVLHAVRKMHLVMMDIADILETAPLEYLVMIALERRNAIIKPPKRNAPNRVKAPFGWPQSV